MQVQFKDLLEINIPVWVLIPFEVNVANVVIQLQEELVELQCDEIARSFLKKETIMSGKLLTLHVNIHFYGESKTVCYCLPNILSC